MSFYVCDHPPGSPAAVQDGCTCPEMDNHRGQGNGYVDSYGVPMYWFDIACPLHGKLESVPPETMCYKATTTEEEGCLHVLKLQRCREQEQRYWFHRA